MPSINWFIIDEWSQLSGYTNNIDNIKNLQLGYEIDSANISFQDMLIKSLIVPTKIISIMKKLCNDYGFSMGLTLCSHDASFAKITKLPVIFIFGLLKSINNNEDKIKIVTGLWEITYNNIPDMPRVFNAFLITKSKEESICIKKFSLAFINNLWYFSPRTGSLTGDLYKSRESLTNINKMVIINNKKYKFETIDNEDCIILTDSDDNIIYDKNITVTAYTFWVNQNPDLFKLSYDPIKRQQGSRVIIEELTDYIEYLG
jgi:hypothetical protein